MTWVGEVSKQEIDALISGFVGDTLTQNEYQIFDKAIQSSTNIWAGFIEGDLVSTWGIIPPTLISDQAYIWLYATDKIKGNEFIFVRQSQMAIEQILKSYPVLVGYCEVRAFKSIRWLKWLGAEFGPKSGKLIPFEIRKK